MTPDELEKWMKEVEERCERATPLEARIYQEPFTEQIDLFWHNPYDCRPERFAMILWPAHPIEKTEEVEAIFENTAKFISHSRTDLPKALAVIRELQKERDRLRKALEGEK